jgi:MtN3 and saliva related transmembrane protein
MEINDLLGYIAAAFTTVAFVPQAWKVHKTKSAKDLSLPMFILFTIGILIWLMYGLLIESYPVIGANAITFLLASYILFHKIKYD